MPEAAGSRALFLPQRGMPWPDVVEGARMSDSAWTGLLHPALGASVPPTAAFGRTLSALIRTRERVVRVDSDPTVFEPAISPSGGFPDGSKRRSPERGQGH